MKGKIFFACSYAKWLSLWCVCTSIITSCSNTKYLAQHQALLVSNTVKLKGEYLTKTEKENIRNDLNSSSILLQTPNYKTLGIARMGCGCIIITTLPGRAVDCLVG